MVLFAAGHRDAEARELSQPDGSGPGSAGEALPGGGLQPGACPPGRASTPSGGGFCRQDGFRLFGIALLRTEGYFCTRVGGFIIVLIRTDLPAHNFMNGVGVA